MEEQHKDIKTLADLTPDGENFNKHTEFGQKLLEDSLRKFGAGRSILVDKDGNIIAGNSTTETAAAIGMEDVIVVPTDGKKLVVVQRTDLSLDSPEGREMAIADNMTALKGIDIDLDKVRESLGDDLAKAWGMDIPEVQKQAQEDDFDPDSVTDTVCKKGDIWKLGSHRLMCGDSTDAASVALLMDGEKADLVFTDPPYGMKKENEGVLNDNLNAEELLNFNKAWIPISFLVLKDNGSWYCWGIDEPLMDIYGNILKPMINNREIMFRNLITWDKGNGQGQLSSDFRMYAIADEKCLFIMKGREIFETIEVPIKKWLKEEFRKVAMTHELSKKITGVGDYTHWFREDGSGFTIIPEDAYLKLRSYFKNQYFLKNYSEIKEECINAKNEWFGTRAFFDNTHDNMNNVWHFDRAGKDERVGHATPKPIALCARGIKTSSREGEIILDLFGGSGTTLIAAEQLNRKCYIMELDPHYCDVIIARWEKLTGNKAERISNGND